jgi:DNA-binding NtrC family response regulator
MLDDVRVLIVEDEMSSGQALADGLRADWFNADPAATGRTVVGATQFRYDGIVLDILPPDYSGYEVLTRLCAEGMWSSVLIPSAKGGFRKRMSPGGTDMLDDRLRTGTGRTCRFALGGHTRIKHVMIHYSFEGGLR